MAWFDDPTFWEGTAFLLFSEDRMKKAAEEMDNFLKISGVPAGARVLDLCCGIGRHTLELARRGFVMTGVDISGQYLREARQRAAEETLSVEFIESDMRSFCRESAFDAAINLYTSFGFFPDPNDDLKVARNLRSSVRPGGWVVFDMQGKETLARKYQPRDWQTMPDGTIVLSDRTLIGNWERVSNRWIVLRNQDRHEFTFEVRLYSAVELTALLREAGFVSITVFGGLDGTPYNHEAKRLVALART